MDLTTAIRKTMDDATPRTKSVFGGANAMTADEVIRFIDKYPVALVSTVDKHGAPHVTGKGVALVDGRVYLGIEGNTAMGRNLQSNSNVALAFAEPPWKHHVLIQGEVRPLDEGTEEYRSANAAHLAAHGWGISDAAEVVPRKVYTWKD